MARSRVGPADAGARPYVAPTIERAPELDDPELRIQEAEASARMAGYEDGLEEGRRRAETEAAGRLARLAESISAVGTLRATIVREAEQDLLQLAARIAEAVVRERVSADSAVAVRALEAALGDVPATEGFTVRCHPSDEEALRRRLEELAPSGASHTLRPDPGLSPGGCIVESVAGDMDARVETQLRMIEHELLARS